MSLPDWVTLADEHDIRPWVRRVFVIVMVTLCALVPPTGGLLMWALLRG